MSKMVIVFGGSALRKLVPAAIANSPLPPELGGPTDEERERARADAANTSLTQWYQLHPDAVKPSHSMFDLENVSQDVLFWLTMLMLGKKDPKAVEHILVTMFSGVSKALEAYCKAGVANRITAWGSGRLLSLYMERLGMITQPQAFSFSDGLTLLSGASIAESVVGMVLPWKFTSQDTQYPDTVNLSETGDTIITGGTERLRGVSIGRSVPEKEAKKK